MASRDEHYIVITKHLAGQGQERVQASHPSPDFPCEPRGGALRHRMTDIRLVLTVKQLDLLVSHSLCPHCSLTDSVQLMVSLAKHLKLYLHASSATSGLCASYEILTRSLPLAINQRQRASGLVFIFFWVQGTSACRISVGDDTSKPGG